MEDNLVEYRLDQILGFHPQFDSVVLQYYIKASCYCLDCHNHPLRVSFGIDFIEKSEFMLLWDPIDDIARRSFNDPQEATEYGATAIAFLIMPIISDNMVIERSRKGTGFDYWLCEREDPLFSRCGRLEISGILSGDPTKVKQRTAQKMKQTKKSDSGGLPAWIVVSEFSKPMTKISKRD